MWQVQGSYHRNHPSNESKERVALQTYITSVETLPMT